MNILQTNQFSRFVRRLHKQQKLVLDNTLRKILANPELGIKKVGDLSGVRVYKFKINKQTVLLAYIHYANNITLLACGSHENFYRDLRSVR